MKVRIEQVKWEDLEVDRTSDDNCLYGYGTFYTYKFKTRDFIDLNDLIIKKKVSTPETLEEYKELNGLSDKNILDMLMKK